ncbi:hypothetical protein F1559_003755 [Cyanidiococcus yangmingshanensis]|uniref:Probable ATP-dependent transporter ycf16 n=1 Tax=Cyanidiococcus yangmingshanensis TaxID=2690220 RepID=A0A7J7IKW2_9RHOD|nr:hypothetical protein F1559_003755 [Cyanidiococcus yangmingshanensis]
MSFTDSSSGDGGSLRSTAVAGSKANSTSDWSDLRPASQETLDVELGSVATARRRSNSSDFIELSEAAQSQVGYEADKESIAVEFEAVTLLAEGEAGTTRAILHEVTFQVRQGETVFVIGPSGAGKSRLLRLVNRLDEPHSGQVRLWGTCLAAYAPRTLRSVLVGFLSQQPALPCLPRSRPGFLQSLQQVFTRDSLRQLVLGKRGTRAGQAAEEPARAALETLVSLGVLSSSELQDRLPEALEVAGVAPALLERPLSALSGGERARLGLARVLLQQPRIVVLDEVTSSLDAATAAQVLERLSRWKERTKSTVFIVTHRLSEVSDGKLLLVRDGTVVLSGDTRALLGTPETAAQIHRLLAGEQQ